MCQECGPRKTRTLALSGFGTVPNSHPDCHLPSLKIDKGLLRVKKGCWSRYANRQHQLPALPGARDSSGGLNGCKTANGQPSIVGRGALLCIGLRPACVSHLENRMGSWVF